MGKKRSDTSAVTQVDVPPLSANPQGPEETGEWETDQTSRAKKLLVYAAIAVVAFLALVGASVIFVGGMETAFAYLSLRGVQVTPSVISAQVDQGGEGAVQAATPAVMQPLGHFVVNLLDAGRTRYINARIEVEVDTEATARVIRNNQTKFRDAVISLIGNRTYADLMDVEGKARLREDLNVRFNRLLSNGQVHRIYFTEFVVQ
ncbi:MAG TPA: hypothetical protein DIU15_06820 [Deltaproteobacteria bacterium]|nr:hypothetical protein [Deltaproteobacteria bacterium]HCP45735.1 hypothetical protein [Deltaproteobacteria bacterium]